MTTPGKQLKRASNQAFTLIEVLVASAVMVILVGIVAFIAGRVMESWNRSSGKLSANAEARFVLDVIARDLETAVLQTNGQQWLRVESATLANNAPYDSDQSDSVLLKLFAPALDRQSGDGICAIAYRLEYKPSYDGGPDTYALYRMVVDPETTLENYLSSGYDDPAADATVQGSLGGDGRAPADWSDATITDEANYLAGNIVSFKVFLYDTASVPDPVNANPSTNAINADYYAFGGVSSSATPTPESTDPLLYADIVLTVVTDEGMQLLNNIEQNLVSNDPGDVVVKNSKTFVRRVCFSSGLD